MQQAQAQAQAQESAPQSLMRGLSEGDTTQLLAAIKQGAAAAHTCASELATKLGFSSEQRDTIIKLAQTLAHGQGALEQAQAAMAQAQRSHDQVTRALKARSRARSRRSSASLACRRRQ